MKKLALLISLTPLYSRSQSSKSNEIDINEVSSITLKVNGFPDFRIADGNDVWITNLNRIEKITTSSNIPVLSAAMPKPC